MATWVITGANRGLGLEFVKQLLASGHQIIAGVRQIDSMPIRHEDLTVFALDVSSGDSVNQFAEQVKTITNQIDVLVNNAGRMGRTLAILGRSRPRDFTRSHER